MDFDGALDAIVGGPYARPAWAPDLTTGIVPDDAIERARAPETFGEREGTRVSKIHVSCSLDVSSVFLSSITPVLEVAIFFEGRESNSYLNAIAMSPSPASDGRYLRCVISARSSFFHLGIDSGIGLSIALASILARVESVP